MGRVSKKIINKDLQKQLEEQLSFIVLSLTNRNDIDIFLSEFLTKEEKIMLGKRIVLYMLLMKGFSSSEIHATLSMSYETIRWYKQLFDTKPTVFKKQLDILIRKEKTKDLWSKIDKMLKPIGLALEAKTNMRARTKLISGNFD
ncbi:MAG TPA: hypothetical protein VNA13_00270 [Xanthomonadales bacterium]|nr:hypothetical protein [Xanthomonadales bacterium]